MEVQIKTWINGTPTPVDKIHVQSKESGLLALQRIGQSKKFDVNHAGYLVDGETKLAILHINPHNPEYKDGYRIEILQPNYDSRD